MACMGCRKTEPHVWSGKRSKNEQLHCPPAPRQSLFSQPYLNTFLVNLLITVGGGVGYYLTSGYMPTFLRVMLKIPAAATSAMLIAGSLVTIVAAISVGALAWRRR